ncbi:hypothetical protein TNCV_2886331 [Trichonephila clavipes]|nr:hypothetical protein TNCV_2886331 [Trichonephila clavipes]
MVLKAIDRRTSTPCLMIVLMNCQTKLRINPLTAVKSVAILERPQEVLRRTWASFQLPCGRVDVRKICRVCNSSRFRGSLEREVPAHTDVHLNVVQNSLSIPNSARAASMSDVDKLSTNLIKSRETVMASSFYSQYGLPTISGLPLHDGKGRYRPEKSMTDSPKGLSQLVAIYFVVFQCNPWRSLFR